MLSCGFDFIKFAREVLANSGRGPIHRGHYYQCIDDPTMKYSLIELGLDGVDSQISMSLCTPKACPDQTIRNSINSALKMVGTQFSVFSLQSNTDNYQFPMNWVSYITAIILISIAIMVFVATVKGYNSNKRQNKWLQSFNLVANMKHFNVREGQDLNILDGIRALAMMWVVFGHSFSSTIGGVTNIQNIFEVASKPFFLVVQAGMLSVDVFLSLGGFFLAFIMLRNIVSLKICGLGILQRALRIWPAYILTMLFYYSLYMKLGYGPFWSHQEETALMCSSMWRQILFISNFVSNGDGQCLGWGWYLQVDFQLFISGVFLLYLYSKKKKFFYLTTIILCILSSVFVFVASFIKEVKMYSNFKDLGDSYWGFLNIYIKPYGRCVPYYMGLLLGVLYMEYRKQAKLRQQRKETMLAKLKNRFELNNSMRIIVQWVGIALMAFISFIPRSLQTGTYWPQGVQSFYWIMSKPIFISGLFMTVLPSCLGISHSFFNLILNAKIFIFIARVSFCTYLCHLVIISRYTGTRSNDIYYNITQNWIVYGGILVLSVFVGFIMTMTIQLPFSNILKTVFAQLKEHQKLAKKVRKEQSLLTDNMDESIVKDQK